MATAVNLGSILSREGLIRTQLAIPCPDNHCNELAMKLIKWELLAPFIGLSDVDCATIKADHVGQDLQRLAALSKWRMKYGSEATYLMLALGLEKIGRLDLVEDLCVIYKAASHDPITDHDNVVTAVTRKEKFQYLRTSEMTAEERCELIAQLERKTKKMKNKFAILVTKTMDSLSSRKKTIENLIILFGECGTINEGNRLINDLKKEDKNNIFRAFEILRNYWSFFDYELVSAIVNAVCHELEPDLGEYISAFKEYCKLRLCEVPADSYSYDRKSSDKDGAKDLYFKIDNIIEADICKMKMEDMKELERSLSELLSTSLILRSVGDGCIELTVHCLHEFDVLFPLNSKQIKELQQLGISRIYTKSIEYYRYPSSEDITSDDAETYQQKAGSLYKKRQFQSQSTILTKIEAKVNSATKELTKEFTVLSNNRVLMIVALKEVLKKDDGLFLIKNSLPLNVDGILEEVKKDPEKFHTVIQYLKENTEKILPKRGEFSRQTFLDKLIQEYDQ